MDRIEIDGWCLVRLCNPADGPALSCTVGDTAPAGQPLPGPGPTAPAREPDAAWPRPAAASPGESGSSGKDDADGDGPLEVSGRGACAYDFGLLDGPGATGDPHPFAAAVPASTKESILRVADPRPDFTLFAGRARRARRKAYRRHNEELFRTADALVRARMHTCPLGQQTDLLSRLVSTPDPETGEFLDAETVRDQILMHLSNGFNGPSISNTAMQMSLSPTTWPRSR